MHALPEVSQLALSAAHTPLLHLPPQHWLSAVHFWVSETHAVAHFLFWQLRLQHSVAELQASFTAAHVVKTDAQV